MSVPYVKFIRGSTQAFANLAVKNVDTLYFISDDDTSVKLYLGDKLIACGTGGEDGASFGLNDLTDVLISQGLEDASFLVYDAELNEWVDKSLNQLLFGGATSGSKGSAGLVPAPKAGEENYFLRGDGTWAPIETDGAAPPDIRIYQTIVEDDESDYDAIARVVGDAALVKGDIAIIKDLIVDEQYQYTAYVYNGISWAAMDGNYDATSIYFDKDFTFTEAVGTVTIPSSGSVVVPAAGKNLQQFLNSLFAQAKDPTITNPTYSISWSGTSTSYEVGTTITPKYTTSFNPGSYEYGPATGVTVTQETVTGTGSVSPSATGTMPNLLIADTTSYSLTGVVNYSDGAVPLNNLGEEVADLAIAAGTLTKSTGAIKGYRAAFAGIDTTTGELTSDLIRGLSTKWNYNNSKTLAFDASTVSGATRFIIAVDHDNSRQGLSQALITSSMNADCTKDYVYTEAAVEVEGANGYEAKTYDVWIYQPASIGASEVHSVKMA